MDNQELFRIFDVELEKLRELFQKKQNDYGPENIAEFGEVGVVIRMNDKMKRLKHLTTGNRKPENESVEDTLRDLSIYGIIALLCRNQAWPGVKNFIITRKNEE